MGWDADVATTPRLDIYREALTNLRLSLAGGHHYEALTLYERLAALAPHDPLWLHRKGDLLRRLGRPYEAARTYERALSLYGHRGPTTTGGAMAWLSHALVQGLDTPDEQELCEEDLILEDDPETGAVHSPPRDLAAAGAQETGSIEIDVFEPAIEEPVDTAMELDVSDIEILRRG